MICIFALQVSFFNVLTTGSDNPKKDIHHVLGTVLGEIIQERYSFEGHGFYKNNRKKKKFSVLNFNVILKSE